MLSLTTRHLLASFLLYCLATPCVCDGLESWGMPHALSHFMNSVVKSKQANDNGAGLRDPLVSGMVTLCACLSHHQPVSAVHRFAAHDDNHSYALGAPHRWVGWLW